MLIAKNIKKSFKSGETNLEVLRGVDIELQENEFSIITGRSGSGKSTLLYILGGLVTPDDGYIEFKGERISDFTDNQVENFRNKQIGFVFQMHHLLPDFTALENVIFPALIGETDRDLAIDKACKLLTELDIYDRKDHFPNQLSGGELQRTAVARALINSPALILADEPTGNLDRENAESLIKLFRKLVETINVGVFIATHNPELAGLGGRKYRLTDGNIFTDEN